MPRQPVLIFIAVVMSASAAACGGDEPTAETTAVRESPAPDTAATGDPSAPDSTLEDDADGESLDNWVAITDGPSGATFLLPDPAEPLADTAITEDGGEVALRNYSATTDNGIELGFNIIDTPGDSYDLDAGVEGVANTLGGEVVSSVDTEVSGQEAVDVEMTYGDDMFVLFTLVPTEDYVMQTLASGSESERPAVEATFEQLTESLEVH
ncbi:MAG TPA: hypothetical protein VFR23_10565 [Jiangellaceae bacterium]|nr:hypothetical protein [Jiangellaceae bacterium]